MCEYIRSSDSRYCLASKKHGPTNYLVTSLLLLSGSEQYRSIGKSPFVAPGRWTALGGVIRVEEGGFKYKIVKFKLTKERRGMF